MKKNSDIHQELIGFAPTLANLDAGNLYNLPANYFVSNHLELLKNIQTPNLKSLPKENKQVVSATYFQNFESQFLEIAKRAEPILPLLNALPKSNLYPVPANYFAQTPAVLLQNIKLIKKQNTFYWTQKSNAILDSLFSLIFQPAHTFAYASFAGVALFMGSYFLSFNNHFSTSENLLSPINTTEIHHYILKNVDEFEADQLAPSSSNMATSNLSETEIKTFLEEDNFLIN